eukprot:4713738-Alexandrium_andersonii.AAC.1
MVEAARTGLPPDEAKALQCRGVQRFPPRGCRPGPIQTPDELPALPWLGDLRGQGHVHVLVDEGVQ